MAFFFDRKKNPKICIESKRPQIAKAILRNKNKARDIILPDFKLYQKAMAIKQCGTGMKTDTENNGTESKGQKMNSLIDRQLVFDKGAKNIQLEKNSLFNKWGQHTRQSHVKE